MTNFDVIHPAIGQALGRLSDPEQSIQLDLCTGKAPGKLGIIYSVFPPEGFHRNDVPARFTFELGKGYEGNIFQIRLMLSLISHDDGGSITFLGFLSHDQSGELIGHDEHFSVDDLYVAVKYWPVARDGSVFLSHELFARILRYQCVH